MQTAQKIVSGWQWTAPFIEEIQSQAVVGFSGSVAQPAGIVNVCLSSGVQGQGKVMYNREREWGRKADAQATPSGRGTGWPKGDSEQSATVPFLLHPRPATRHEGDMAPRGAQSLPRCMPPSSPYCVHKIETTQSVRCTERKAQTAWQTRGRETLVGVLSE